MKRFWPALSVAFALSLFAQQRKGDPYWIDVGGDQKIFIRPSISQDELSATFGADAYQKSVQWKPHVGPKIGIDVSVPHWPTLGFAYSLAPTDGKDYGK